MGRGRGPRFLGKYVCGVLAAVLLTTTLADTALPPGLSSPLLRCLVDNGAHSAIAVQIWLATMQVGQLVEDISLSRCSGVRGLVSDIRVKEFIIAALCGSLLDSDHFLAANSTSLQAATSLSSRPKGHALIFILCATLLCYTISSLLLPASQKSYRYRSSMLVTSSLLSHQLRDSTRRGLWLYPFNTSLPVSYAMYLCSLVVMVCTLHYLAMNVACFSHLSMACRETIEYDVRESEENLRLVNV